MISVRSLLTACMLTAIVAMGLATSPPSPREWRDYAGGPDSSRFVAATGITRANVGQLQVAWAYPDGQTDFNPLVVRGVVYGRGPNDSFVALDARTGREIWRSGPVKGFSARRSTCPSNPNDATGVPVAASSSWSRLLALKISRRSLPSGLSQ